MISPFSPQSMGRLITTSRKAIIQTMITPSHLSKQKTTSLIRGLRFCPKCRIFLNRDKSAARNIGLLNVLRHEKSIRPLCFTRKKKSEEFACDKTSEGDVQPRTV